MKRELKFRVWDNVDYMTSPFSLTDLMFSELEFTTDCPVMQYTGLKDKNGKEIYEGDIIQTVTEKGKRLSMFEILWSNSSSAFKKLRNDGNEFPFEANQKYFEVIGNRYQNAELLAQKSIK